MFDEVAPNYDKTNLVLSAMQSQRWRKATVAAVAPKYGEHILDLAAGTGASSVPLSQAGAAVTAADFSLGMLEVGRERYPQINFVHADAVSLPFDDDSFDAVTISFGLRNVVDVPKALSEMFRVTKPGGRIVICEFSTMSSPVLDKAYRFYLRNVLPKVAKVVSSNSPAYGYLGDSIEDWPNQSQLSAKLGEAGWRAVAYKNLSSGIVALHRGFKPEAG